MVVADCNQRKVDFPQTAPPYNNHCVALFDFHHRPINSDSFRYRYAPLVDGPLTHCVAALVRHPASYLDHKVTAEKIPK
ncbi:hypothetical protein Hanom_Chr11g01005031 [Helianthus anomalus]